MIDTREILSQYEEILRYPTVTTLPATFFKNDQATNQAVILTCLRFALEYILYYTPQEAGARLTEEDLERLKLSAGIKRFIKIPYGLEGRDGMQYLVHLCYPSIIGFTKERYALIVYLRLIRKNPAMAKNFFTGDDGLDYALICMRYALRGYLNLENPHDMYQRFGTPSFAKTFLRDNALDYACRKFFNGSAVAFLHYALEFSMRDEYWFYLYQFRAAFEQEQPREAANE